MYGLLVLGKKYAFPKNRLLIINQRFLSKRSSSYDIAIVGGGIVGTAAAREILFRNSNLKCALIEKENDLGTHQSSHNSGVIHAGIYYKPGSVRAKLCTEGMDLLYEYLDQKEIPYKKVGKLIVATNNTEVEILDQLYLRGIQNNVKDLRLINSNEINSVEPHCIGEKAIHSPHTGIVDYAVVTKHFGKDFVNFGGKIHFDFEVNDIKNNPESCTLDDDISRFPVKITSKNGQVIHAGFVLTCGGLYADKLAAMSGGTTDPAIIPFRGEYLILKRNKQHLVKGNIYPVPDMRLPFLGVHFTPKLDGSIWLGPNAVLAFKREGYGFFDFSVQDLWHIISYSGFRKISSKYFMYGLKEQLKSIRLSMHVEELKKYVPDISVEDVCRGPTGVRAQAVSLDGNLVEDFIFDTGSNNRVLHCRNTPSPAATSSLAIARVLTDKVFSLTNKL